MLKISETVYKSQIIIVIIVISCVYSTDLRNNVGGVKLGATVKLLSRLAFGVTKYMYYCSVEFFGCFLLSYPHNKVKAI